MIFNEYLVILKESITTFDKFLSETDLEEAHNKWDDIYKSGKKGQIKILNYAKKKDQTAVNWLFDMLRKVISQAFWKYYIGPMKNYGKAKVLGGKDKEFAAEVYAMLLGDPEAAASPLKTFNPNKFSENTDVIKKFGYYLLKYAQSLAFQMIRSEVRGGVTGNIKKGEEEPTSESYELHFSNEEIDNAINSFTDDIEIKMSFEKFLEILKKEDERGYKILIMKALGKDFEDIAKKIKISSSMVRELIRRLKQKFLDFIN